MKEDPGADNAHDGYTMLSVDNTVMDIYAPLKVSRYQLLKKDSHHWGWLVVLAKQNGRMDILSVPCMRWNDLHYLLIRTYKIC